MPQYKYKQRRVNLSSFSIFNGAVPTAEKWGLAGIAVSLAIKLLTQSNTGFIATFALSGMNYIYQKYKQDQAVGKYYEEIRGVYDPRTNNYIYENSENVKLMGGKNAINNACATRIFCP